MSDKPSDGLGGGPDDEQARRARPASGGKRFLKLAGMTAGLAGRYAGHKLTNSLRSPEQKREARQRLNQQAGENLAATLGELKGAVMKLGQFASQVGDFLPAEIAGPLQRLQQNAPPVEFAVIRQHIEAQLGQTTTQLFAELDEQPYAAASIGQVHRARLHDGREVVVKVQYPGVAESCDSDLRQLKRALRMGRLIQVDKHVLDAIFEEISQRLHEELDYHQERKNLQRFAKLWEQEQNILIPLSIDSHCSAQVLTLEYLPGITLDKAAESQRKALAERLFSFMARSLFEFHCIHADPNPGNFACNEAGQLIVYDFGCIKEVPVHIIEAYQEGIVAALAEDWNGVDHALMKLGARVPGSARLTDEFYAQWRPIILKPFLAQGPFDFGKSTIHKAIMAKSPELMQYTKQLQPTAPTLYIDRMISGHYWTLVNMAAQLDVNAALNPWIAATTN